MKIVAATLFSLRIPFVEAFAHSIRSRTYSDSIVVRVEADDGTVGYGEAVARPYVTGETVESCLAFMTTTLWPAVQYQEYPLPPPPTDIEPDGALGWLNDVAATLPTSSSATVADDSGHGVVAWNAARAGWEVALIDCLLKAEGLSLSQLLPPTRSPITYSGVITASGVEQAVKMAKRFKQFGIPHLKVKVTGTGDRQCIAAIRDAVGAAPSLRIDGNGAYSVESAIATCADLADFNIDSAEQLIPRGQPADLAAVQAASPIPQMADESLITMADAEALIDAHACEWFNLRISKCGGLAQTVAIAQKAEAAGIRLQLGCQVGETAILSAAGRHLAAWLPTVEFVEGSYGKLLLTQDVSRNPIHFGHRGQAPILTKPGLGVEVQDDVLDTFAYQTIHLSADVPTNPIA
ncbi:MAG: enolase C-terminal domain-like protein [Cyanobacteria bacterium P01_E01_bin.6]